MESCVESRSAVVGGSDDPDASVTVFSTLHRKLRNLRLPPNSTTSSLLITQRCQETPLRLRNKPLLPRGFHAA